ncbi:MAG: GTPase Era, partial [Candidatus Uhrbacteria bacterium]
MAKLGIVTIAGRSNVGKSTLLNALVGVKAAITSPMPQTTRRMTRGVFTDDRGQIVFVDSPGIFESNRGPVTRAANEEAREALKDVDLILYVVDPTRPIGTEEQRIFTLLRATLTPKILIRNKCDLPARERVHGETYEQLIHSSQDGTFIEIIDVSALKGTHTKRVLDEVFSHIPEGEPLYPAEQRTDVPKDRWVAEIIREKIFLTMTDEIP